MKTSILLISVCICVILMKIFVWLKPSAFNLVSNFSWDEEEFVSENDTCVYGYDGGKKYF